MTKVSIYKIEDFTIHEQADLSQKYVIQFSNGKFIKVSAIAKSIIEKLTGNSSDRIIELLRKENIHLSKDELDKFVNEFLGPYGIVISPDRDYELKQNKKHLWYHKPILKGSKFLKVSNYLKVLFNKVSILSVFTIFLFSSILVFGVNKEYLGLIDADLSKINLMFVPFYVFGSLLFHELGHISSLYFYGIAPRNVGIGIYLFRPVAYTDMTDAWMLDKKKRIVTDLAGIYFDFILLTILISVMIFTKFNITIIFCIFASLMGIINNLDPFLRWDGYWLLSDWLNIPNIHTKAFDVTKFILKKLVGRKAFLPKDIEQLPKIKRRLLLCYLIVYLLVICAVIILGLFFLSPNVGFKNLNTFVKIFNSDIARRDWPQLFADMHDFFVTLIIPFAFVVLGIVALIRTAKIGRRRSRKQKNRSVRKKRSDNQL